MDHIGLVVYMAKKFGAKQPILDSVEFADGWIGLMRATQTFDPNRPAKSTGKPVQFATYASGWIKAGIMTPRNFTKHPFRAGQLKTLPLSQFSQLADGSPSVEFVDDEPIPADRAVDREQQRHASELANKLLSHLDPRTRRIVERHVMHKWILDDVAANENPPITRERVRQIVYKAVRKLAKLAKMLEIDWSIPTMEIFER